MKSNLDWLKDIPPEEIITYLKGEDSLLIAKQCGVPVFLSIFANLSGIPLNIPKNALDNLKRLLIKKNYNGSNVKELALKFGLTTQFVYDTLKNEK